MDVRFKCCSSSGPRIDGINNDMKRSFNNTEISMDVEIGGTRRKVIHIVPRNNDVTGTLNAMVENSALLL